LKAGDVTWRAEFDKKRQAHTIPLSPATITAVREAQQSFGAVGEAWVFPSPVDATKAIDVDLLPSWWERLEKLAGVIHVPGRAWHSLRRKFATEHQDLSLPELMALGGWKDHNTLLKCYPKPREAKLRAALARREASSI
jgi:integrase